MFTSIGRLWLVGSESAQLPYDSWFDSWQLLIVFPCRSSPSGHDSYNWPNQCRSWLFFSVNKSTFLEGYVISSNRLHESQNKCAGLRHRIFMIVTVNHSSYLKCVSTERRNAPAQCVQYRSLNNTFSNWLGRDRVLCLFCYYIFTLIYTLCHMVDVCSWTLPASGNTDRWLRGDSKSEQLHTSPTS